MHDLTTFIENLPQIVPEGWCLQCKICCRFPAAENVQAPTWSPLEAGWVGGGARRPSWLAPAVSSPSLMPTLHACGNGFLCPAFRLEDNRCSIYAHRPLDCRLYPFVLVRDPGGSQVALAMDMKCPYLESRAVSPEVERYIKELVSYLEGVPAASYLKINPDVVGAAWPEFVFVASLPHLASSQAPSSPHPLLHPLTMEDLPALKNVLGAGPHVSYRYSPAAILGWMDLIHLWWARIDGAFCIFAEQAGGFFMPLPPLSKNFLETAARKSWALLEELNQGSAVSRIEGVEAKESVLLDRLGWQIEKGEEEYLYRTSDAALLSGGRFKSQRWSVNRAKRRGPYRFRPFTAQDLTPCLQLYTRWGIKKQFAQKEFFPKALIRDGLFFHRRLMMETEPLGLVGRVCEMNGKLIGYTFGAAVSPGVFCVLLEVADREVPGAAALIFRELCSEIKGDFPWVNTMGDEGLAGLRRNKISYCPAGFVATVCAKQKS